MHTRSLLLIYTLIPQHKMSKIEVSPMARDPSEIPEMSFADFVFDKLTKIHLPAASTKPWLVDVTTGRQVLFGEIEDQTRKIASALTKFGLRHRDILYYVTYDTTFVFVASLAAWRLGIAVRGSYQKEEADEYERQMREGNILVAMVDAETAPKIKQAVQRLEWRVKLINLSSEPVTGTTPFEELLKDNGSAFSENVKVNAREDVLLIPNTSGSTGLPKGAIQTHHAAVAMLYGIYGVQSNAPTIGCQLIVAGNFAGSFFFAIASSLYNCTTIYAIPKFCRENFFDHILKHKPNALMMYPYVATWFARAPELTQHDFSFIKVVGMGGSIVDPTTSRLLSTALPQTMIIQAYALSEVIGGVTMTTFGITNMADAFKPLKTYSFEGKTYVTTGKPFPYTAIVEPDTEMTVGRMNSGEILVRAPYVMKGYLVQSDLPDRSDIDSDGWLHTGDLGFFDDEGYLYVQERKSFVFKYYMFFPGLEATEDELKSYVEQRLPEHLHLHGGVRFLAALPSNRGGKLDRGQLRDIAAIELEQET
ncbi:hypothetical protein B566_EDAN009657, partial [Ephemera danica]